MIIDVWWLLCNIDCYVEVCRIVEYLYIGVVFIWGKIFFYLEVKIL